MPTQAVNEAANAAGGFLRQYVFNMTTAKWVAGIGAATVALSALAPVAAASAKMAAAGGAAAPTGVFNAIAAAPKVIFGGPIPEATPDIGAAWDAVKVTFDTAVTEVAKFAPATAAPATSTAPLICPPPPA